MIYAHTRSRYQVSVYRTIGPLVLLPEPKAHRFSVRPLSVCHPQCSNIFSETAWSIKAKFCVKPLWVGELKFHRDIWVT